MLQISRSFVTTARPLLLARWLLVVAVLIVAMVSVGGITRLTESGLSITSWKPITGVIPPLTDDAWAAEFANYRQIPQYEAIHHGMTLAGFKAIFFWEYLHREMARVVVSTFALPLAWFALRRRIPAGYGWRLSAIMALLALQAALGWLMVRSGLSDRVEVAPLWLSAHLLTALFTLAGVVWTALDLVALSRVPLARPARLTRPATIAGAVLAVQLFYGALMAGLRAGLVTNQWPLMNGRVFPSEVIGTRPFGALMIDDPSLVHFIHRWWAWIAFAALVVLARQAKAAGGRRASMALHVALGAQILLGIATVMSGVGIVLAALHQLVGAALVGATTWGAHSIGRRMP